MKHRNGIIKTVMKVPKKVYLAAAVLLFMGGAGTAVALYPESEPKKVVVEQTSSVAPQEQATEPIESPPAVVETVVEEEAPVPAPEQPKYGESNSPGVYIILDTSWALTEAGIPQEEQAAAEELIDRLSGGWIYRQTTNQDDVNAKNRNLCRAYPKTKMSIIADDYETNPVTQLKWCHKYVNERIGTWQQALDKYLSGDGF